ncbi:hypothetical protein ABKN59_005587 [Abortiporus biennis]
MLQLTVRDSSNIGQIISVFVHSEFVCKPIGISITTSRNNSAHYSIYDLFALDNSTSMLRSPFSDPPIMKRTDAESSTNHSP